MIIQKNKLMWNSKPYIMGVVNVTPDSFSGDGIMGNNEGFLNLGFEKALGMEKDGADIIDVGGESTRPKHIYQGAQSISANEEMERVLPLLEKLKNNLAIPISIDTQKGVVAKYALQSGAKIINDVSMMSDDVMVETLIKYKPIYILSHHRKTKHSTDIINDIYLDLDEKIQFLLSKNFPLENIIIDPGIGFGKNSEQSFYIIKNLKKLISRFNIPLMIGTSKKSFLENITGETLDNRDIGTYISNFFSLLNGSYIVRVHDVMNTKKIVDFYKQIEKI